MSDDLVTWLRPKIEARLGLAREAAHGTDGHWWRGTTGLSDGGPPEPVGPLYAGEPVIGYDDEVFGGEHIVVYDEGAPSGAQFEHMEANDPRDVIARCEAELAILADHASNDNEAYPECRHCAVEHYPCRTARLLASGYRHRDGYKEEWKP